VSDERCRACGAAVPDQAQWCSLCFADLRTPAPVPDREPVSVPAAAEHAETPTATPAPQPLAVRAPAAPRPVNETCWPCPRCRAWVPIELDACGDCGAGFLAGATTTTTTHLPLVGDMAKLSQGARLLVGAGISIVLMIVFVVLAEIGGHLF
jgi:hypothetical protein